MAKERHLHEERGITFAELGALLGVRELLQRDLLAFVDYNKGDEAPPVGAHVFDMNCALRNYGECGSVGCIGGMMAAIMGMNAADAEDWVFARATARSKARGTSWGKSWIRTDELHRPLENLFFPPSEFNWSTASPKLAVHAIDNWLATGEAGWHDLLVPNELDD